MNGVYKHSIPVVYLISANYVFAGASRINIKVNHFEEKNFYRDESCDDDGIDILAAHTV